MVPNRETVIVPGDRLAVATLGVHSFKNILAITGHDISETIEKPRTLIIGGGGIGILAASNQLAKGCLVTILESDLNLANAVVASENGSHKNLEVVHGEITDESLLDDIEIEKFDLAISSLKDEVQGIAAALIAHEAGVKMTGVILGDSSLANAARSMGITHVVNRRKVAIDSILKEVHHKLPGAYGLLGGERDIVGMSIKIREGHSWIGMPVNELKNDGMPEDCIIGYIQRDAHEGGMKTLRPKGDRKIRIGDRLLLFTPADRLHEMEDLMEG